MRSDGFHAGWSSGLKADNAFAVPATFAAAVLGINAQKECRPGVADCFSFVSRLFGSQHTGGCHFGMADGSVNFVSENVDINLYRQSANISDGLPVGSALFLTLSPPPGDPGAVLKTAPALFSFRSQAESESGLGRLSPFSVPNPISPLTKRLPHGSRPSIVHSVCDPGRPGPGNRLFGQFGPVKYVVSGTVTLKDGKPAPAGEIMFEPDAESGNKGSGSFTQIRNGSYSLPRENGVSGGKYVVYITPFDGIANKENAMGNPMVRAPQMEKLELPMEDTTKDFQMK